MKIDKSIYDLYSDKKVDEKFSIRQESGKLKYYIKKECSCGKVFITRADDNREEYECCDCAKITSGVKRRGRKAANRHSNKESVIMASAKRVFLFYKRADQNDLDFETFMILVKQNCFYCGIEPSNKTHVGIRKDGTSRELKKRKTTNGEIYYTRIWASDFEEAYFIYNGLDRVDQKKPHNKDNIVPCCKKCNFMKSDYSREDFLQHIKRIIECQIQKNS